MPNHRTRVYESMLEMLSNETTPRQWFAEEDGSLRAHKGVRQVGVVQSVWCSEGSCGGEHDRGRARKGPPLRQSEACGADKRQHRLWVGDDGQCTRLQLAHPRYPIRFPREAGDAAICRGRGGRASGHACVLLRGHQRGHRQRNGALDREDFHMLNQYKNEANIEAHIKSTGPEIWRQTAGRVTHFVASLGTCGTVTGNGRFLKGKDPNIKVYGVHPKPGHNIPGVRSLVQFQQTDLFKPEEYDGLIEIDDAEAFEMCLRLNREESIIAGPSAAMALCGALKVVEDHPDALVVVIFPDNVFKYASTFEESIPKCVQTGLTDKAPVRIRNRSR